MRECPYCKTMLEDDELFCHECGTKQETEESVAPNEEVAPLEKKCIHCGEIIEEDSAFCPYCGKPQTVEDVEESLSDEQTEESEPEKESVTKENIESEKEEPISDEKPEPKKTATQEIPEEQISHEVEEEKKSKKWIWILLAILLAGAGAWYFFSQIDFSSNSGQAMVEALDTDSIEEPDEVIDEEIMPTSARGFLEYFYKGNYGEEGFIKQNVTANVLNKLKRDYPYDCPSNDCLATWVFTAYPAGADMDMEEGPIISETDIEGRYKVDFKYSFYNGEQKGFDNRTVYLTVSNVDGKYVISDYELVTPEMEQSQEDMPDNIEGDADAKMAKIPDGDYFLSDGRFKMKLQKRNSKVNGEFFFFDGSDRSADYLFSGNLDDNNMINAEVCYAEKSDRNEGTIKGVFNGEEFNVRVCLNYGRYNGNYKLKEQ